MTLAMGLIPFGVRCSRTGGYLAPASFTKGSGRVPCSWEHWEHGSDTFHDSASYLVGRDGLLIYHPLHPERSELDASIVDLIRAGEKLYWSYGGSATPEATQADIEAWKAYDGVYVYDGKVEPAGSIGHVSYVRLPAIGQQSPIFIV